MSPKDTNPKTAVGQLKAPLCLVPPVAIALEAEAMADGAAKYGPYNWREKAVSTMTYLHAAQRHLAAYLDGQDRADDSAAHHLAHARACLGIVLDAEACGQLVNDRPKPGGAAKALGEIHERRKAQAAPPLTNAPGLFTKAAPDVIRRKYQDLRCATTLPFGSLPLSQPLDTTLTKVGELPWSPSLLARNSRIELYVARYGRVTVDGDDNVWAWPRETP